MADEIFKIAVVDDEPSMTKLLKMVIEENFECDIDLFNDSSEALEQLKTTRYDVISLDHRMPKLSGMDLVKLLRSTPGPNQQTKIILLTAFREEVECTYVELLDEVVFQNKPIDEERYVRMLDIMLKTSSMSEASL